MLKYVSLAYEVSNLTDARYFAAWGVDWISFKLDGPDNSLKLETIKNIREWINGPKIALQMQYPDPDFAFQAIDQLQLDGIHVLASEFFDSPWTYADIPLILEMGSWQNIQLPPGLDLKAVIADPEALAIIRREVLGSGYEPTFFQLVSGHGDWQTQTFPERTGLAVAGSAEEKTGFKSFDELDELFESLYYEL